MKKSLIFACFILSVMAVSLVSAFSAYNLSDASNMLVTWIKGIFSPIFQALLGKSVYEYFFEKVLFLILLYVVILTILRRINVFRDRPFVYVLISAIISLIATRYMTENQLFQGILVPYGAMGTAILVFLPLVIYFVFVNNAGFGITGRRAAWILFSLVFVGLWYKNSSDMGQFNWIYTVGIVVVILLFIFDRQVHRYFEYGKFKKAEREPTIRKYMEVEKQLEDLEKKYGGKDRSDIPNEIQSYWDNLKREEKKLRKHLS